MYLAGGALPANELCTRQEAIETNAVDQKVRVATVRCQMCAPTRLYSNLELRISDISVDDYGHRRQLDIIGG